MTRESERMLPGVLLTLLAWFFYSIGLAQSTVTINGDAVMLGPGCYQLTDSFLTTQASSVWVRDSFDLNQDFDITFYVTHQNVGFFGADGMSFILSDVTNGFNAVGPAANGMGFAIPSPFACCAITPSFAVEIDVFDNTPSIPSDLATDHLALVRNGVQNTPVQGPPVDALPGGTDITDGTCKPVRVRWVAAVDSFYVWFNGNLRIAVQENIRIGFTTNYAYFGWTGGSGGIAHFQSVCYDFAQAGADTAICLNDSLVLNATGGVSYSWSPAAQLSATNIPNPIFRPTAFGSFQYIVTVTNQYGCSETDTIILRADNVPTAIPGPPQQICPGDSVMLGGPANPTYAYLWSPAAGLSNTTIADPMASPAATTMYYLDVTDTSWYTNCAHRDSVLVTVAPNPVASAGPDTSICAGDSVPIGMAPVAGVSYAWTPTAGLSNPTRSDPNAAPAATTPYILTATNGSSTCTADDTVIVSVLPAPMPNAGPDTVLCDTFFTLSGNAPGAAAAVWTDSAGTAAFANPMQGTTTVSALSIGMNTLVWTFDNGVCQRSDTVRITVSGVRGAYAGADTAICGTSLQLAATPAQSGHTTWWSDPGSNAAFSDSTEAATAAGLVSGPNPLVWHVTDGACTYTDTVLVWVDIPDIAFAGADSSICGTDVFLYASPPTFGAGQWHSLSGTVGFQDSSLATTLASGLNNGANALVWTLTNGACTRSDTVIISADVRANAAAGVDSSICTDGLSLYATVPMNGSGSWTHSGSAIVIAPGNPGSPVTGLATGGNTFVWTVDNGTCQDRDTLVITRFVPPSPVNAGPDQLLAGPAPVNMNALAPANGVGTWSQLSGPVATAIANVNDPGTLISGFTAGNFTYRWTVSNGVCPAAADEVTVFIEQLTIPTGFSPNGDGRNDIFVVRGLESFPGTQLQVFNRWGNEVFRSDNYQNDWTGINANGATLADDTYYFVLDLANDRVFNGFLVIKR